MLPCSVALDNTVEVETPEHVRFRYRVAGPVRRTLAYLLDLLVRIAVLAVLWIVISFAVGRGGDALKGVMLIAAFLLEWGYYVLCETTGDGRSPGKRALGLRVVKEGGFPVTFTDSVLRNLLRGADFLPFGYIVGFVAMASDSRFRRLGDHVAGTIVVVEEAVRVAPPLVLRPAPTADELEGWTRRPYLSAWERETLEIFLRRTDLTDARREELALVVAPAIAQRLGRGFTDPVRFLALVHRQTAAPAAERAAAPAAEQKA
jgi:uncharacterized RDD family membrane protein YckC